ncbi:Protein regulator of cytokinesis 1, partial [Ophiophagus hannah]
MAKRVRESEVLASSLVNSVNQAMGRLLDLWDAMGIGKELQLERMHAAKSYIETLLEEMIDDESSVKEKLENDIEIQKNQLNMLRYQLGLDPYKVDDGLTILQLEKEYRMALDSALKEKQERLEKLTQLQREDQALCAELCEAPYYIPTGSIPNSTQLEEVKEHVTNLLKVKLFNLIHLNYLSYLFEQEQRLEEFHKLRREIRLYSKEIGHTPDGTLENDMLRDNDEEEYICLTKKYLEDLQQLIHEVGLLVFLIYIDNFSEELLHYHDEELFKVKMLYEEDKCLYDTVHKWEAILDRFIEFEKKSTDPSRLLNRGGNLLKDERERSKTQKQLSKVKCQDSVSTASLICLGEELKKNVENWEKEHNSNFLIRSQRFLDSMARQLQHYKLKKDQPKTVSCLFMIFGAFIVE